MFHENPYTIETVWLTMPERIFTQFLISQNVAILSWLVMLVVGLIDIEHAVCNKSLFVCLFLFSNIATILVIWKPSDHKIPS